MSGPLLSVVLLLLLLDSGTPQVVSAAIGSHDDRDLPLTDDENEEIALISSKLFAKSQHANSSDKLAPDRTGELLKRLEVLLRAKKAKSDGDDPEKQSAKLLEDVQFLLESSRITDDKCRKDHKETGNRLKFQEFANTLAPYLDFHMTQLVVHCAARVREAANTKLDPESREKLSKLVTSVAEAVGEWNVHNTLGECKVNGFLAFMRQQGGIRGWQLRSERRFSKEFKEYVEDFCDRVDAILGPAAGLFVRCPQCSSYLAENQGDRNQEDVKFLLEGLKECSTARFMRADIYRSYISKGCSLGLSCFRGSEHN